MDFSIKRIESGPVRGLGAPMHRKDRAPEFTIEGEEERPEPDGDRRNRRDGHDEQGAHHDHDDDTPISPKLDDEAGGRLDVTA